jgi:uncharacterized protein (TIGR01777 family)
VFINASAIGIYGNRENEELTEQSSLGNDFLADVCIQWEQVTQTVKENNVRIVHLRTGIVLSPYGGALKQMLLPFKLGVGGNLGNGKQWMSWISLEDEIRAIMFALKTKNVKGAINLTAPLPVTNATFTKALGKTLKRPTLFSVPSLAVKLLFGEMGESLLLSSQRVLPKKLLQNGFEFKYENIEQTLHQILQ